MTSTSHSDAIAIIGMAGRFPGARDLTEYWQNLLKGFDIAETRSAEQTDAANLVRRSYPLKDPLCFDAEFFGLSPAEAALMDPQQRLLLENAWHTFEDAGYDTERYQGAIGVFASTGFNDYVVKHVGPRAYEQSSAEYFAMLVGNDKDFSASRIAYHLDLTGPAVVVQSACSSSLLCVHQAVQSLLSGECDMALATSCSVYLDLEKGYHADVGGPMSPSGQIRAFDAKADGILGGNGVAAVLLKPYQEALADGDNIQGVIRGIAANNDGNSKLGFTAPSVQGQTRALAEALALAASTPKDIGYIEAHGTGTPMGDPMEFSALNRVYGQATSPCVLGSVKTNVGHLNTVAGLAGLIKASLVLKHRQIPATLHFNRTNPQIDFENSRFRVNPQTEALSDTVQQAAVSSFGFGGTNVHAILQAPTTTQLSASNQPQLLCWSGQDKRQASDYYQALQQNIHSLPDLAATLALGRRQYSVRQAAVSNGLSLPDTPLSQEGKNGKLVLLFPGQGSQFPAMAQALYLQYPLFRDQLDECAAILAQHDYPLFEVLFNGSAGQLRQTLHTQVCLFACEYSLASWLISMGAEPDYLLGHSIGEYVAACIAGVFSLSDALSLVVARARLVSGLPEAAMLAIAQSEAQARALLHDNLSLAVVNGPESCVLAGDKQSIAELAQQLKQQQIPCQLLQVSHGFHSHLLDPLLEQFTRICQGISMQPARIPLLSNLTGALADPSLHSQGQYWVDHLRQTVRFGDNLSYLTSLNDPLLLVEAGPGLVLTGLSQKTLQTRVWPMMPNQEETLHATLTTLGKIWVEKGELALDSLYGEHKRHALPSYPFVRQQHKLTRQAALPHKRSATKDWLYQACWQPSPLPLKQGDKTTLTLVFAAAEFASPSLLADISDHVLLVSLGEETRQVSANRYQLNPVSSEEYHWLIKDIKRQHGIPGRIIHAWLCDTSPQSDELAWVRQSGYSSLIWLTQALAHTSPARIELTLLSCGLFRLLDESVRMPAQALATGAIRSLALEHPWLECRALDLTSPTLDTPLARILCQPLETTQMSRWQAWRGGKLWQQEHQPCHIPSSQESGFTQGGAYLITGGAGGVGLELVNWLAGLNCRLIITGRRPENKLSAIQQQKLANYDKLEYLPGDMADPNFIQRVKKKLQLESIHLDGIIHAASCYVNQTVLELSLAEQQSNYYSKARSAQLILDELAPLCSGQILLCSSITSALSGIGCVDYASANAYLDALAIHSQNQVRSINWDSWRFVGELGQAHKAGQAAGAKLTDELDMSVEEALTVTRDFLASPLSNALVSTSNWRSRCESQLELARRHWHLSQESVTEVAPNTDGSTLEQLLTLLFAQVLGLTRYELDQDFLLSGGDSLQAVRLLSRLRSSLAAELSLSDLLDLRTPEKVAAKLARQEKCQALMNQLEQQQSAMEEA